MEHEENGNPRLGVQDKRDLFQGLLAKTERLLFLNPFPVDIEDFALSLQTPDVEKSWRILRATNSGSLLPTNLTFANILVGQGETVKFVLALYPEDSPRMQNRNVFMRVSTEDSCNLKPQNIHYFKVKKWAENQIRLEDQILRTAAVLKGIVHSCNTVGQYKRVSPELLGFLPSKYQQALGQYLKQSPYPAIDCNQKQIDAAMSTLAFASLQTAHSCETRYATGIKSWGSQTYQLEMFPTTMSYRPDTRRSLNL